MTEEAVVISVDSTDVELAAARFDQLRGASEAAAEGLDDVGAAGEDAAEGLDDAADGAERLGRQSAGSSMSVGKLTAGILSGAVALQGIRAGLRFAGAALREYVAGNEEAQRQTAAVTEAVGGFKESLGAMIVNVAESTGVLEAMASVLNLIGGAMDAIAGRSAAGIRVGVAGDLNILRGNAEQAAGRVSDLQREMDALAAEYQALSPIQQVASDITRNHVERYAALEAQLATARGELDQYTAAVDRSSQAQAAAAVSAIQYAMRLAQFGGPNSEAATPGGGGAGARLDAGLAVKQEQIALAQKANIRRQAAIESFNELGEIERQRLDAIQAQADRQLEIERSKNEALAEMRAETKALEAQAAADLLAQEQANADARRETWRGLLTNMRDMAVNAGNALAQALGKSLATGDGQELKQSFRSIFAGVLGDMGRMVQAIALPMLIPSPFNPMFNPVAGGLMFAAGTGLQVLSGAFGAASGGGGGGAVSAPSASRELPTRSRDGGNTEIYQSLSFGFVGDRRAVIREVYDVLADGRRLGMAQ